MPSSGPWLLGAALGASWLVLVAPKPADARPEGPAAPACIPADRCCKVCDRGVACGNTCISRKKVCHVGRGCACNDDELC